jgi:type I restriction enzyme R subunit
MKPEEEARKKIDELLTEAGWLVQNFKDLNIGAGLGVAVREFPLKSGFADYMLFVERHAVGVVEAKPIGTTLSGVSEQTEKYLHSFPADLPHVGDALPFAYESTGAETFFRDIHDPDSRSRRVFAFHKPETLHEWVHQEHTLRARLRTMPPLITEGLRDCQIEAIENLERSFAEDRPRALIQMASGSGKTFAAVTFVYRLIKFAGAKRILFLVDRNTLGKQTLQEFQQYSTPDDGRKFTELYNVQRLTSNKIDDVNKVVITTIQRLYSMLKGEADLADPTIEEASLFEVASKDMKPVEVKYNPSIPIEMFDFIVTDECHRSIYHLWRQVLEYFDAFIIGLTATPSKQTLGFFNQNLVMEYGNDRAVADGVNVAYEVYRIATEITQKGSKVDAGFYVDKRDKLSRKVRWEQLDEDLVYESGQLDRDVVAPDQIRTVIRAFKDKLFTDIFPERTEVPKTLVFAKDDSHAEDIVQIVREEFGKGNEFCKKITYKTTGEKTEDLIASFRNSYYPRIAVTVDMISTGTDIRPLECLLFMRDVRSGVYFEQMKGRGTRTVLPTDLNAVTPDAYNKLGFVIIDAVGVCESDKTDSRPLERRHSVPFEKLIMSVALGARDQDTLSSLAGRLARFDKEIDDKDRMEVETAAEGKKLGTVVNELLDALDPDKQLEKAKELFKTENPTVAQLKQASQELANTACSIFDNPRFRTIAIDMKKRNEQIIDTVSKDSVIYAGADEGAKAELAKLRIKTFQDFIKENKDELTALQILYSQPYGIRHLTYDAIKQLAEAIKKPPYNLTPELVWMAYGQLEKSKVKGAGPQKLLTNMVSLVRFAIGADDVLQPFSESVNQKFDEWLTQQEKQGRSFTSEQLEWLNMIKDHIMTSAKIGIEDFENVPFNQKGGAIRANKLFGQELNKIMEELNTVLVK